LLLGNKLERRGFKHENLGTYDSYAAQVHSDASDVLSISDCPDPPSVGMNSRMSLTKLTGDFNQHGNIGKRQVFPSSGGLFHMVIAYELSFAQSNFYKAAGK